MPQLLTEVRDISRIAYGFFASRALFAALNLELFGHLEDGPHTLSALSAKTGVAENGLATLLAALASAGLVGRLPAGEDSEGYVNSPAASRYLAPGARAYFGDYYRYQIDRHMYPQMRHIDAGLRADTAGLAAASMSGMLDDPVEAEAFSRAQHAGSLGPAMMFANIVDLSGARSLLDVAGGTGAYSIAFCSSVPDLTSTIIDFPTVVEVARRYINDAGMEDRIRLVAGDALEVDWPVRADVVLMSYLLSAVGKADIPVLLNRALTALRPGGRLLIHDFMLDDDRQGPPSAAGFFLYYLALRTDPISFTAEELMEVVRSAGFENISQDTMLPDITKYVSAFKPTSA